MYSAVGIEAPLSRHFLAVILLNLEQIVAQVRKVDSVEVANYLMERMGKGSATAELIHPDELVAGVISQVAAEPDIGDLLAAFVYSSEGKLAKRSALPSPLLPIKHISCRRCLLYSWQLFSIST